MVKQLIFDCDGVLVDTEIVAAQVMVATLAQYNINITIDHYLSTYTGSTFSGIFKSLLNNINEEELKTLISNCEHNVYDQLKGIEGMDKVVKAVELPKAVVSNSFLWQIEKALQVTKLESQFSHKFSAQMVKRPKPSPDIYLYAADKTGVTPEECLVIEDSKTGVTAAYKAGMKVIGFSGGSHIRNGHDEVLREKGAILTADTPQALLLAINQIIKS